MQNFVDLNLENRKIKDLVFDSSLFVLGAAIFFCLIFIKKETVSQFFSNPIIYFYAMFVSVFRLSRITGALFYKHSLKTLLPIDNIDYEPRVSFIIPCKNEEQSIEETVAKCFEVDYPENKIEAIVINDGSTDYTINRLDSLEIAYPRLVVVDWRKNKGKRHGMAEGFRKAK